MDVRQPIPNNGGDWITKFGETWKKQVDEVRSQFAAVLEEVRMPPDYCTDVPILYVKKEAIVEVLVFLKEAVGFEYNFLADITATDEEIHPRFEVVYNLFSTQHRWRIRVKVRVGESEEVPSAAPVRSELSTRKKCLLRSPFGKVLIGRKERSTICLGSNFKGTRIFAGF